MMQLAILHKIEQLFYKVLHILEEKNKKRDNIFAYEW